MTIGATTTCPSDTGNIGLPAERSTQNTSSELEKALKNLPTYLPAFEPASWDDPAASQGSRRISARSRGSARASLPITYGGSYHMISVESGLEYNWAIVIDGLLRPKYFIEQPPAIDFLDVDGVRRRHTFDFYIETEESRIYIQVKPLKFVERDMWEATMGLIATQLSADEVDEVLLLTDEDLHPDMIANAKLMRYVRRCPALAAEDNFVEILRRDDSIRTIGELVSASGLDGVAFVASLRLIDHGLLTVLDEGRISYASRVRFESSFAARIAGMN